LAVLLEQVAQAPQEAAEARSRASEIRAALAEHGMVDGPDGQRIWAYEIDGRGEHRFLDDANVPSLLSLPYLGCVDAQDPVQVATPPAWRRGQTRTTTRACTSRGSAPRTPRRITCGRSRRASRASPLRTVRRSCACCTSSSAPTAAPG